jgi:hypothetical protein
VGRDPNQYVDGPHLSGYTEGNPTTRVDPLGLEWTVKRTRGARASVVGECGDTVEGLAQEVGLKPSQFVNWLRSDDGMALPLSATMPLANTRRFTIPNTVFVGVGRTNWFAHAHYEDRPLWIARILKRKGYKVVRRDWRVTGPWHADDVSLTDLYGLVYFGHGRDAGLWRIPKTKISLFQLYKSPQAGWLDISHGDDPLNTIPPDTFLDGQLGLLILKSCYASNGGWGRKASDNARQNGTVWIGWGTELGISPHGFLGILNAARNAPE